MQQCILFLILLGLLYVFVCLVLFVLEEVFGTFFCHFGLLELSVVFEFDLLHFGLEVTDLPILFHELDLVLCVSMVTNSIVSAYSYIH